jgi:hypothetical protein
LAPQRQSRIASTSPRFGSALTTTRESPRCEEEWVLRDPDFGNYDTPFVADTSFHGGIFGPDVAFHEDADHLIWLFPENSRWLPPRIHDVLLDGLTRCTARWPWLDTPRLDRSWPAIGSVQKALWAARRSQRFRWSAAVESDWLGRIALTKWALNLPETTTERLDRVRTAQLPERWLESEALLAERRRKATARNHAAKSDTSPARTAKRPRKAKLAHKSQRPG